MKTTIAINLGHKFVAVQAEPVTIHGFRCGIHKSVGDKPGWTVTFISHGIAAAKSNISKRAALDLAGERIGRAGEVDILERLSTLEVAPPVDGLELHVVPVKAKLAKINLDVIVEVVSQLSGNLSPQEQSAVRSALNSRTGQLKANSPSDDWGKAAWNGLQPNAWKIQFSACFLRGEPAELLTKLSKHAWPIALDKDLSTLRALGVA